MKLQQSQKPQQVNLKLINVVRVIMKQLTPMTLLLRKVMRMMMKIIIMKIVKITTNLCKIVRQPTAMLTRMLFPLQL